MQSLVADFEAHFGWNFSVNPFTLRSLFSGHRAEWKILAKI